MNENENVTKDTSNYLNTKSKQLIKRETYNLATGKISDLKEKRKIRVHRRNIENIQQANEEINKFNFSDNQSDTKLDNKISTKNNKIANLDLQKDLLLEERKQYLNENPVLKTSLGYLKKEEYSFTKDKFKDNKEKQKKSNQKRMAKKVSFQGDKSNLNLEEKKLSSDVKIETDKEEFTKKIDQNKFSHKRYRKNISILDSPLTARTVGERNLLQKTILTPKKVVSKTGAGIKDTFNEEVNNSEMAGVQLANDVVSPIARKVTFETNKLIAKKVGFDRKAYNLSKMEKKIMKSDKELSKIKKAQRKNIRKKAKINAKLVKGSKMDMVYRVKNSITELKNLTTKKIVQLIASIKQGNAIALLTAFALIIVIPVSVIYPVFAVTGSAITIFNSSGEGEDFNFSATSLNPEVLKWENELLEELKKHGIEKYLNLALVIMQIESGGKIADIMQSSESAGLPPNTIKNEKESIKYGAIHLKKAIDMKNKYGVDNQTLIHSYNYGVDFIPYVANRGKKWTQKIANEYSDYQANRLGWSSYGDKNYVTKALSYLVIEGEDLVLGGNFDLEGGKLSNPLPNFKAVSSSYGWRIHPTLGTRKFHTGTDIPAPTGTPVLASADGKVIEAGWKGTYGNTVMIDHGSGVITLYAHNSSLTVTTGQTVKVGQEISRVGSTGRSTGPHLHFEVRVNGEYTDPLKWIN